MLRVLHIAILVLFWFWVLPIALVLAFILSLKELILVAPYIVELVFDLGWFLLALCFHLINCFFHLIGVSHAEKNLFARKQLAQFLSELRRDVLAIWRWPRSFIRNFFKVLGLSGAYLHLQRKIARASGEEPAPPAAVSGAPYDFEGHYQIVERLPSGGSTAQLFVVTRRGGDTRERLVIKYFDLSLGSHLENIVRESGAVRLATRLGIVLDSKMTKTSFYYVMPYYHGSTLTQEVRDLHGRLADGASASEKDLTRCLGWMRDLLGIIVAYHERGVFHKDIKPDNLIVEADRLHLVDIGLLTPLESTLQLTTHGTEFFRDPEMVRLAARGVSIRDVDCAKFDIYSIGAVFYFMLEGGFPASGSLSRFSRSVPVCLQWICNRAMTDFEKRYSSAQQMLQDVEDLLALEKGSLASAKVSLLSSFEGELEDEAARSPAPASPGPFGAVFASSPPAAPPAAPPPAPPPGSPPPPRRGHPAPRKLFKVFAILVALGTLLLIGIVGTMVLRYQDHRSDVRALRPARADVAPPLPGELRALRRPRRSRFTRPSDLAYSAAESIAAYDSLRRTRGLRRIRVVIVASSEDPQVVLLVRELKLALAHESLSFETRAEASRTTEEDECVVQIEQRSDGGLEVRTRASSRHGHFFWSLMPP